MLTRSATAEHHLIRTGLAGLVAMAAAMGFGRFSFTPILPGMMAHVPLTAGQAGAIASANFFGYLVGAVVAAYGWAAGRERTIAISALAANVLLLAAMGLTHSLFVFAVIRFLAGIASAFCMVFVSGIVLSHGAAAGSDHVPAMHFGGVGFGIAISSVMVFVIGLMTHDGAAGWRLDWLVGAALSLAALAVASVFLPAGPVASGEIGREPRLVWNRPMLLLMGSYGLFGFGYVITATFLVTIARAGAADHLVEFISWLVAGLAAMAGLFLWKPAVRRFGTAKAYIAALVVEAVGVLASVTLPHSVAPIIGGLLFGGTFLVITAYGLQIGRKLAPKSPRGVFSLMTAAFGIGQILGPVVAGWLAGMTGSFTLPTIIAAAALVVCALLMLPILRDVK